MLIRDVLKINKELIDPQKHKDDLFHHFSLPAFDNNKTPEIQYGANILSSKFKLTRPCILFNKLNVRFKRIWNILATNNNDICSSEFLPLYVYNDLFLQNYMYYLLLSDEVNNKLILDVNGTSSSHQRIDPNTLLNMEIQPKDIAEQQHIVNILGTIDDKIENNIQITAKIREYMQLIFSQYEKFITNNNDTKIGDYLTFIKGKKPLEGLNDQLNYLNIEGMETNIFETKCADNMVVAEENDLLMVMDGASSGDVYSGYNGIVGSTMAKLLINPKEYTPIIEQKLIQMKTKIRELNTGSAIPHANKEYISSLSIKFTNDQKQKILTQQLLLLKNEIFSLRKQNIKLNRMKQLYLKKFFD